MVAQNSPCPFCAKICNFFDGSNVRKRHRLHTAYAMFTRACMVAYAAAYAGSIQRNTSRLYLVAGHLDRLEKVARPERSCAVFKIRYKNIFSPKSR